LVVTFAAVSTDAPPPFRPLAQGAQPPAISHTALTKKAVECSASQTLREIRPRSETNDARGARAHSDVSAADLRKPARLKLALRRRIKRRNGCNIQMNLLFTPEH
jgi:hypothetical protein